MHYTLSSRLRGLMVLMGIFAVAIGGARAAALDGLYQAAVEVPGMGVEARNQAIAQALEKVLVKITGSRTVTRRPQAKALLKDASALAQQYRYERLPAAPQGADAARLLVVRFDQQALQQALQRNQLPAWGSTRPTLLLWLGIEQAGQRRFYKPETDTELSAAVAQVSRERGIDFLPPLLDMEDLAKLRAGDLWGGFDARIRQASERYGADLILIGRLAPRGAGWKADWQLLHGDRSEAWSARAASAAKALSDSLQTSVDRVAARYAPLESSGPSGGVLVRVSGLDSLHGYVRVERFLRALDAVETVALARVEADQAWFRLDVRGGVDALRRGASLGGVLSAEPLVPATDQAADSLPDLSYRLTP